MSSSKILNDVLDTETTSPGWRALLAQRFEPFGEWFKNSSTEERGAVLKSMSEEHRRWYENVVVYNLSIQALRTKSESCLELALIGLIFDSFRSHPRSYLSNMATIVHVAERIGLDGDAFLRSGLKFCDEAGRMQIEDFLSAPRKARSLDFYSFVELATPEGPTIKYIEKTPWAR